MFPEQLAVEHHRIHVMEHWPEGPLKTAGIAAASSRLQSLTRLIGEGAPFVCLTCSGNSNVTIVEAAARPEDIAK